MSRRTRKTDSAEASPSSFYSPVLGDTERTILDAAWRVDGVDDEIALLRARLRELLKDSPDHVQLQMSLAIAIARLVKTRHQISSQQKKTLKAAVTQVLEEVAVPLGIGIGVGVGGTLTD